MYKQEKLNKDQPQDDPEVRISKDLQATVQLCAKMNERKNHVKKKIQNFSKAKL